MTALEALMEDAVLRNVDRFRIKTDSSGGVACFPRWILVARMTWGWREVEAMVDPSNSSEIKIVVDVIEYESSK